MTYRLNNVFVLYSLLKLIIINNSSIFRKIYLNSKSKAKVFKSYKFIIVVSV